MNYKLLQDVTKEKDLEDVIGYEMKLSNLCTSVVID